MFTVKHVTPIGNEALYSANEVTFSRREITDTISPPASDGTLWLSVHKDQPLLELRSGTAYVMNEHGSTVGTYRLVEDFEIKKTKLSQDQYFDNVLAAGQSPVFDNSIIRNRG